MPADPSAAGRRRYRPAPVDHPVVMRYTCGCPVWLLLDDDAPLGPVRHLLVNGEEAIPLLGTCPQHAAEVDEDTVLRNTSLVEPPHRIRLDETRGGSVPVDVGSRMGVVFLVGILLVAILLLVFF